MKVRIWDLPTRLFHWALVACVISQVITASIGGNAMQWHFRGGYTVISLLLFRLVWGFVGGRWSRFSSFVYAPRTVLAYVGGRSNDPMHQVGHSPLGSLSVLAMLLILVLQVGAGLFADDEISNQGPLAKHVSTALSLGLTSYHKSVGKWILLALVLLHIGAIAFYRLRRGRRLTRAMVTGDMDLSIADVPASRDTAASRMLALVLLVACFALVEWLIRLAG